MHLTLRKLYPPDCAAYRQTRLDCLREFPDSFGADYAAERTKPELYFEGRIRAQAAEAFMLGVFGVAQ